MTLTLLDYVVLNGRMIVELKTIWKEAIMASLRYYPSIFLEGLRKPLKNLFRISNIPAQIETECLPHVNVEFYHYASLLSTQV
jgi:hypothetical protein